MLITYSKKKHGDLKLSSYFKVSEFACKDGSDTIIIDSELIDILHSIRVFFNKPVNITSGYRTEKYDKKVGGSGYGYHTKGRAVDIYIEGVSPIAIGVYALELLGNHGGIEIGNDYCHIDTRSDRWRAFTETGGSSYRTVSDFGSHLKLK